VQLTIYDNAGRSVQTLPAIWVEALPDGALSLSSPTLSVDGQAQVQLYDSAGRLLGAWNGVASDGGLAGPGAYRIHAAWSENGTVQAQKDAMLMVQPQSSALLKSLLVAPDPAGRNGGELVSLRWIPDGKTVWIRASIYNLAGERVQSGEVLAAQGRADWGLRSPSGQAASSGIYLWEVEAVDGSGRVLERRGVKFVVLR
jgi:hypothetical protein